tara:strand:- start:1022 stop:2095 length:1074 start_codon:yes stop_codon:yes gene_type:complete
MSKRKTAWKFALSLSTVTSMVLGAIGNWDTVVGIISGESVQSVANAVESLSLFGESIDWGVARTVINVAAIVAFCGSAVILYFGWGILSKSAVNLSTSAPDTEDIPSKTLGQALAKPDTFYSEIAGFAKPEKASSSSKEEAKATKSDSQLNGSKHQISSQAQLLLELLSESENIIDVTSFQNWYAHTSSALIEIYGDEARERMHEILFPEGRSSTEAMRIVEDSDRRQMCVETACGHIRAKITALPEKVEVPKRRVVEKSRAVNGARVAIQELIDSCPLSDGKLNRKPLIEWRDNSVQTLKSRLKLGYGYYWEPIEVGLDEIGNARAMKPDKVRSSVNGVLIGLRALHDTISENMLK